MSKAVLLLIHLISSVWSCFFPLDFLCSPSWILWFQSCTCNGLKPFFSVPLFSFSVFINFSLLCFSALSPFLFLKISNEKQSCPNTECHHNMTAVVHLQTEICYTSVLHPHPYTNIAPPTHEAISLAFCQAWLKTFRVASEHTHFKIVI